MNSRTIIRLGLAAALFLLFLLHIARVLPLSLLDSLERATYDARVLLTMPNTQDQQVVIVDLDEKSITVEGHWPWPRDKFASIVTNLFDKYKIRVLGMDINFPEADTRSSGLDALNALSQGELADLPGFAERLEAIKPKLDLDAQFGAALKGRAVVLGNVLKEAKEGDPTAALGAIGPPIVDANATKLYNVEFFINKGYTGNLPVLQDNAASAGYFDNTLGLDIDGVFRRVPVVQQYKGALYPSLALEVTRLALGAPPLQFEFDPPDSHASVNLEAVRIGPVRVPVDEHVEAFVPYRGRWPSFEYISATEVIRGTADPAKLAGKIVLLGTSAPGLLDLRATPVGQGYPGVEVHANLIAGMLDGRIKHKAPYYDGIHAVMLLSIALLLGVLAPRLSPLASAGLTVGLIVAIVGSAFALWSGANFIIPLGTPVLFALTLFLLLSFYGFFIESRGKREISKLFGEYIPPELVEELAANPQGVNMEGDEREMSVLFSDVRGFTTISEKLNSKELSELMNQFLTPLTKVIQQHRGTIDKYMGDAIMAFWGAPLRDPKHAENALLAGMDMVKAVRGLDAAFEKRGWPKLYIGVGINTGTMRVGNMGSEFRRAYTVMGDPVNLGSRLEAATKDYGVYFIVSEFTRSAGPADWAYRELDLIKVKGKDKPVTIYEPLGPKEQLDPALRNDLARHRGAMKLYRTQLWDQAEAEFFNLSRSGRPHKSYQVMLDHIEHFRANPPGPNWDGSFTRTSK